MTTLRISITKEVLEATKDCDIDKPANCAISYAIREIWPKAITYGDEIILFTNPCFIRILHGQDLWIYMFDSAKPPIRSGRKRRRLRL